MVKSVLAAAVGLAVIVAGAGAAVAGSRVVTDPAEEVAAERAFTEAHQASVPVSAAAAERAALSRHDGRTFDTHLQDEDGLRWETKVDDGVTVWEVQVDPQTGAVVSDQPDE